MNLMIYLCYYGKENKSMKNEHTDNLEAYKPLSPFKFWCQKVLPLVYDDSLSYYELLCKIADYLNKAINNLNLVADEINSLYKAYDELQNYVNNYFNNINLQEEVNNWLDSAISTGKLQLSPFRYNIMNENGNSIEDKIISAINKGYDYLYVPTGEYNLTEKTIEISKFVDILFSENAIVHAFIKNGAPNTFIYASSDFILTGGKFIGEAHAPSYGNNKIPGFIVGKGCTMSFNNVTFDTFQPYNFTAAQKPTRLRTATIITCYDCSLSFEKCNFYNILNYEFMTQLVVDKNKKELFTIFDSCVFKNVNYSINLRSGNCRITNCYANTNYDGSLFNAFCTNIYAINNKMNIISGNSFIDNTEGGFYNSDYVYLDNNDCSVIIFSIKSVIKNTTNVTYECTIKIDVDFDYDTYRVQPKQLEAHFSECDDIKFVQINVEEATLNVTFDKCSITNNTPNSTSKGVVKFFGCRIAVANSITGKKQMNYIGCTLSGDIKTYGTVKPVLFSGCVSEKEITLYKISDTNDEYIVSGCYNINKPN